jgi:hypothetical protein
MCRLVFGVLFALLCAASLPGQSFETAPCPANQVNTNNNGWLFGHQERVCEVRRATLPLINGQLSVSGTNGGIEVIGEERQDVDLEARIIVSGYSRKEAESLEREVKIVTSGTIRAEGPQPGSWLGPTWSVTYRLRVPRHLTALLHTENGGLKISNVIGVITADTKNGGLTLDDLAGEVRATTVNGGLDVRLDGTRWRGSGLFVSTTNGGVSVKAPHNYSAHLVAETVSGRVFVNYSTQGTQGSTGNHIETDIGQGGPTVHFQTVHGHVEFHQD